MDKITVVLEALELIVRGKSSLTCERNLHSSSYALLRWSSEISCNSDSQRLDTQSKQKFVTSAIALHNKVRAIPAVTESCQASKCLVRASVAWLLTAFGDRKDKLLCLLVRLHSRAAHELLQLPEMESVVHKSVVAAIMSWESMDAAALEKILSGAELDEIRLAVFNAYLLRCKLFSEDIGNSSASKNTLDVFMCQGSQECDIYSAMANSIKTSFAKALVVAQELPNAVNFKVKLIGEVLKAGCHIVGNNDTIEASVFFFDFGLSLCESCSKLFVGTGKPNNEFVAEMNKAKYNYYISLAYAYQEMKQYERAMVYVDMLEAGKLLFESSKGQQEAIGYTKSYILCKSQQFDKALTCLFELLEKASNHASALKMILILVESYTVAQSHKMNFDPSIGELASMCSSDSDFKISPKQFSALFGSLEKKFPVGPDLLATRLSHLRYLMASDFPHVTDCNQGHQEQFNIRAATWDLCLSISKDFVSSRDKLDIQTKESFLSLLSERSDSFSSVGNFSEVLKWAALALQMYQGAASNPLNDVKIHNLLLLLCEANVNCRMYAEALSCATKATKIQHSSRAILWVYLSSLFAFDVDQANEQLRTLLDEGLSDSSLSDVDSLNIILLSMKRSLQLHEQLNNGTAGRTAQTVSGPHSLPMDTISQHLSVSDYISVTLIREWLLRFVKISSWKCVENELAVPSVKSTTSTYLGMLCRSVNLVVSPTVSLQETVGAADEISNSSENSIDDSTDKISEFRGKRRKRDTEQILFSFPTSVLRVVFLEPISRLLLLHTDIMEHFDDSSANNCTRPIVQEECSDKSCTTAFQKEARALSVLGGVEDLLFLVQVCLCTGQTILKEFALHDYSSATFDKDKCDKEAMFTKMIATAELFEQLQLLQALLWKVLSVSAAVDSIASYTIVGYDCGDPFHQASSLCCAASIRLDSMDLMEPLDLKASGNIAIALKNIKNARKLNHEGKLHGDPTYKAAGQLKVIFDLEILCSCRYSRFGGCARSVSTITPGGSQSNYDSQSAVSYEPVAPVLESPIEFLSSNKDILLEVYSAADFLSLIDRCAAERHTTIEVTRVLLELALQVCVACECPASAPQRTDEFDETKTKAFLTGTAPGDSTEYFLMLSRIYCRIVTLAPSREKALHSIDEFVKVVRKMETTVGGDLQHDTKPGSVITACAAPIEDILILSYNYGLNLNCMGQYDLSERFLSKSIQLLNFVSPIDRESKTRACESDNSISSDWRTAIQETYSAVLKAKKESHNNASSSAAVSILNALSPLHKDSIENTTADENSHGAKAGPTSAAGGITIGSKDAALSMASLD